MIGFVHKIDLFYASCGASRELTTLGKKTERKKKSTGRRFFPGSGASIVFVLEGFPEVWVRAEDSPRGCTRKN